MVSSKTFLSKEAINNRDKKLIVFPHSGSGPGVYMQWEGHINDVQIIGVQYPGRGSRIIDPFFSTIDELVESLIEDPADLFSTSCEYFFFGHSLGAIIAYELAKRLEGLGNFSLRGLFVSSLPAPNLNLYPSRARKVDENELLEMTATFSKEMLIELERDNELREYYLELLNEDLSLLNTLPSDDNYTLKSDIHAFGGIDDTIPKEDLGAWKKHTEGSFFIDMFEGGHFYYNQNTISFFNAIRKKINGEHTPSK